MPSFKYDANANCKKDPLTGEHLGVDDVVSASKTNEDGVHAWIVPSANTSENKKRSMQF